MILNMKNNTLEFCVNGINQGIAFKNIGDNDEHLQFHLAVCMSGASSSVQLKRFEIKES